MRAPGARPESHPKNLLAPVPALRQTIAKKIGMSMRRAMPRMFRVWQVIAMGEVSPQFPVTGHATSGLRNVRCSAASTATALVSRYDGGLPSCRDLEFRPGGSFTRRHSVEASVGARNTSYRQEFCARRGNRSRRPIL
jgi:hypothetical protein